MNELLVEFDNLIAVFNKCLSKAHINMCLDEEHQVIEQEDMILLNNMLCDLKDMTGRLITRHIKKGGEKKC